jgi:hypothetical protein
LQRATACGEFLGEFSQKGIGKEGGFRHGARQS